MSVVINNIWEFRAIWDIFGVILLYFGRNDMLSNILKLYQVPMLRAYIQQGKE